MASGRDNSDTRRRRRRMHIRGTRYRPESVRADARDEGVEAPVEGAVEGPLEDEEPVPAAPVDSLNEQVMTDVEEGAERLPEDWTPQSRMASVRQRASGYEREYRMRLIHRMLMRNTPLDEIARHLEISVSTVRNERRELYRRLKEAAQKLDINVLLGDTLAFYGEVSGMALRIATSGDTPVNMRLAAMRTSMTAKSDMGRFLSAAGVFDAFKYVGADDGTAETLMETVTAIKDLLEDQSEILPEALSQVSDDELFGDEINRVFDDDDDDVKLF